MAASRIPIGPAPVTGRGSSTKGDASSPTAKASASLEKPAKVKLIRDGFTIPEDEYRRLAELKVRTIGLKRPAKKSELLRAGILVLCKMSDRALLSSLAAVPSLKTGRPRK